MINAIKATYKDFISFLKNPTDKQDPVQTKSHQINRLLSLLAIDIPIMAVLTSIIYIIEKLDLININDHKLLALMSQLPIWQ
ncbi:MAG: hypothetical protein V4714_09550, partial [Bacteroidota bacterium]